MREREREGERERERERTKLTSAYKTEYLSMRQKYRWGRVYS